MMLTSVLIQLSSAFMRVSSALARHWDWMSCTFSLFVVLTGFCDFLYPPLTTGMTSSLLEEMWRRQVAITKQFSLQCVTNDVELSGFWRIIADTRYAAGKVKTTCHSAERLRYLLIIQLILGHTVLSFHYHIFYACFLIGLLGRILWCHYIVVCLCIRESRQTRWNRFTFIRGSPVEMSN